MAEAQTASVRPRSRAQILSLLIAGGGLIILGAVALAYLFWTQVEASSLPGDFESAIPITVDYRAPKLELKDIDGKPASLADYAGQVVLVNNWAFWCPPCRAELPVLERYYQDHRAQGFTIIGIESGDSAETVGEYIDEYQLTYPIWLDPRIKAVATFNNRSLPNSFVIDGDGQVRLAWTGPVSREMLEDYVTPLLEK